MMGSTWENHQLLLKGGMTAHCSRRYLFGNKQTNNRNNICKCIYQNHMSVESGNYGRKRRSSWMVELSGCNSHFKSSFLIDKREENLRKKLKYPIKALGARAFKGVLWSIVPGTASGLGWERSSGMAEQRAQLLVREETPALSD